MKYAFVAFILIWNIMMCSAQSVFGIPFGSSYNETKEALEKRFGRFSVHEDDGTLSLANFKMGGFEFNFGEFEFQYGNNNSYLNSAYFQRHYPVSKKDITIAERDYLYSLLKEKYEDEYLEEYKNQQGYKCYKFGINPFDPEKVLGLITLDRGVERDGTERLYLCLSYLPIYYLDKSSDF